MSESPFSPSWYRVADLRPRIRSHGEIHRHDYRGEIWYVLEDRSAGRYHRFSPAIYQVIGLMDGERTVQAIWDAASENLGNDAPTQEEVIRLLGQLHGADMLQSDVPPDMLEVFRRHQKRSRHQWIQRLAHPLAIRVPLFDPERILTATLPLVRPLFGWVGLLVWLACVLTGLVLAASHWEDLTSNLIDRVLTPENLFLLWFAYPAVKAVHEFGHAYATKVWGGEVHEMGVMFLVLVPIPYVEASAASAFREKRKRMVVGGIGIMVELFIASIALMVWLNVEPGNVRALAYNVMLIGGVSTLFFNGNPLLRFDGYYVLADALEIPNLATRAKRYLGYLVQRYVFGVQDATSPATVPGERFWFTVYGIASFVYRLFILAVIALFVASKFFVIGVLLATWAVASQVLLPLWRNLTFVLTSPRLRRRRVRALAITGLGVAGAAAGLLLVPVPLGTFAEGVVWLPEQSQVRAATNGFVRELLVPPETHVRQGQPLLVTEDPSLPARVQFLEARMREIEARLAAVQFSDSNLCDPLRKQRSAVAADLRLARERSAHLVIESPADGVFLVPDASDLPGRYLRRGELVGFVTELPINSVRVVVGQDAIGLVRERTEAVEVVAASWSSRPVAARIVREVPAASNQLPSRALGTDGGGRFLVDPRQGGGTQTFEKVFQLDLAFAAPHADRQVGPRVFVRFDHGDEPLAQQWYRSARQLFLSHFGV